MSSSSAIFSCPRVQFPRVREFNFPLPDLFLHGDDVGDSRDQFLRGTFNDTDDMGVWAVAVVEPVESFVVSASPSSFGLKVVGPINNCLAPAGSHLGCCFPSFGVNFRQFES